MPSRGLLYWPWAGGLNKYFNGEVKRDVKTSPMQQRCRQPKLVYQLDSTSLPQVGTQVVFISVPEFSANVPLQMFAVETTSVVICMCPHSLNSVVPHPVSRGELGAPYQEPSRTRVPSEVWLY